MTCIAAITDGKTVWMGGDSAAACGWDISLLVSPKVFRVGECLIGGTGDVRALQILEHAFSPPTLKEGQSIPHYFAVDFVNALRDCLKSAGYAEKSNEKEKQDSLYLVGFRGHLVSVHSDYGTMETTRKYAAYGCGGAYAEGSLHTTNSPPYIPEARIRLALEAAENHSAGVRGPFTVLSTGGS